MTLSHDDVQDILALLDSLPYAEVSLETSSFSLRLRRAGDGLWAQEAQVLTGPVPAGAADHEAPGPADHEPAGPADHEAPGPADHEPAGAEHHEPAGTPAAGQPAGAPPAPPAGGLLEVRAPLLGTFYRSPQPGAAPFVDIGSPVSEHTVVAIIETMKLMNAVHAGVTGTVAEVCLADGQFAAQGTVLMRVRPPAG